MEYIAAVLGHLNSDAFSFLFSLFFFCFNLIYIGEKKQKAWFLRHEPTHSTHTPRGEEAHMKIQFMMTMVPTS